MSARLRLVKCQTIQTIITDGPIHGFAMLVPRTVAHHSAWNPQKLIKARMLPYATPQRGFSNINCVVLV